MLSVGNAMYLLIPSPSKKRVLHPGKVIESDATSFAAEFEESIAPPVGGDVNAFCEVRGKFFQQGAVVSEIRTNNPCVIVFRRNGEPVSAESRQTYRVSLVTSEFVVDVDKESGCRVLDISPEGFAAFTSRKLSLGSMVKIRLTGEGETFEASARVQTVQERGAGKFRYGFLVPQNNAAARKKMQQISIEMQRMQLKRLRGAA
jgi:PilZ domain